jgi:GTP-binding protein
MIKKSEFLLTLADPSQMDDLFTGPFLKGHGEPRIAMVGRSNVGKSSLINALLGVRLAQTSNKPGKTRAIHFYHWKDAGKIIADLPGYGFAKAAKSERDRWEKFIHLYFQRDENLERAIVLLDARHGPTESDLEAIEFLSLQGIPVTFVFAKADTLKTQSQRALRQKEADQALKSLGRNSETALWVSVHSQVGLKQLVRDLKAVYKTED